LTPIVRSGMAISAMDHTTRSGGCPRKEVPSAWCGYCYSNKRGKGNYKGHIRYRAFTGPAERKGYGDMERPTKRAGNGQPAASVPDLSWKHKHPRLAEHLTETKWSDGAVRQTSTLTVFIEGELWKVALNDREGSCSLYKSGDSLVHALESLEKALSSPEPEWRAWTGKRKK